MKEQQSYIKDTTQFINFIEGTRVPQNAVLVSMDVTSLYTNIPQEEGITTICHAYDTFYTTTPPIPTHYLREMLRLTRELFPIQWKRLSPDPWYSYGH